MSEKQAKLTTHTFVPISFILVSCGIVGAFFSVRAVSESNKERLNQINTEFKLNKVANDIERRFLIKKLSEISNRLSNMEGYLKAALK